MRIGIIIGSTRPGRSGAQVGRWVHEVAVPRGDAEYLLVDLLDHDLGLLAEATVPGAAKRDYENPNTRAWSRTVDALDGFVFVTPEYNHSVPAAMKNAVDLLFPEWNHKGVTFVGYGSGGASRAVEHWRGICAGVHLHATRGQLALSTFRDWRDGDFAPGERRVADLGRLLDELVALSGAVAPLRRA